MCKGRLDNATLPYETKFPVWLPKAHHILHLIIVKSHEMLNTMVYQKL